MGRRKIAIKENVAHSIAEVAWYIESKGLATTAAKFADAVYDYFVKLSDTRRSHTLCRDPKRASLGFKCITYKRKYTIVFLETDEEILVCEFIPSKNIQW